MNLISAYLLIAFLYWALYIHQIREQEEILVRSKSRELKIIAKIKIERSKREVIFCLVWPYLAYLGIRSILRPSRDL
jgi:hypothetical protein